MGLGIAGRQAPEDRRAALRGHHGLGSVAGSLVAAGPVVHGVGEKDVVGPGSVGREVEAQARRFPPGSQLPVQRLDFVEDGSRANQYHDQPTHPLARVSLDQPTGLVGRRFPAGPPARDSGPGTLNADAEPTSG
ncbi:hypothetical protein [Streptomyces sp. NBC_00827]|uniref:hypothetical protein n=1 Tax=Streptomyces sp. NBC_00827 TaxID=2903677 RepID=UPI0038694E2F|nr:hypothetical protein OG569_03400 [Streptomyces sp. NBC_00827]